MAFNTLLLLTHCSHCLRRVIVHTVSNGRCLIRHCSVAFALYSIALLIGSLYLGRKWLTLSSIYTYVVVGVPGQSSTIMHVS